MIEYKWNKSEATMDINRNVISWEFMLVGTEDEYSYSYSSSLSILPADILDGEYINDTIIVDKKPLSEYTKEEVIKLAEAVSERYGWKEGIRTAIKSPRVSENCIQQFDI